MKTTSNKDSHKNNHPKNEEDPQNKDDANNKDDPKIEVEPKTIIISKVRKKIKMTQNKKNDPAVQQINSLTVVLYPRSLLL